MPFLADVGLNARVLTCAAMLYAAAVAWFAFGQRLRSRALDVRGMAEGGRGSAARTWHRIGTRLVLLELAAAVVLLASAGLLRRSFDRLLRIELGFSPNRLALVEVAVPSSADDSDERRAELGRRIAAKLEGLPGVRSAALASVPPVTFNGNTDWIRIVGRPYNGQHIEANQRHVSAAYLQTIGAALLRGRLFTDRDDGSRPRVAIVNKTFAQQHFPGEDPVGSDSATRASRPPRSRRLSASWQTREGPLDSDIWPAVYYPFDQRPGTYSAALVRSSVDERSLLPAVVVAIRQVDPGLGTRDVVPRPDRCVARGVPAPVVGVARGRLRRRGAAADDRRAVRRGGVLGGATDARDRRAHCAGCAPASIYRLVLREVGALIVIGSAAGIACAIGAATFLRSLLFETGPVDVPTLSAAVVVLAGAALAASFFPARRAASVDPVVVLAAD